MTTTPMPFIDADRMTCEACGAQAKRFADTFAAKCSRCGSWRSNLEPTIDAEETFEVVDAEHRSAGLRPLRDQNNATILASIEQLRPLTGAHLLDVGSAHGWFLEAAESRGMVAEGLEPEAHLRAESRAAGRTVRGGYFPDAVTSDEKFDVITFNDVLEHIPDVDRAVGACAAHLAPGGVLSINIPVATGLLYRVAVLLRRIGVRGPFERLWQFALPSPHLHYFTLEGLTLLLEANGMEVKSTRPLSSIRRNGLWHRLHAAASPSPRTVLAFAGLWLLAPLLDRPANSDILLLVAQRTSAR